jgi:hypothetical protein
MHTAQFDRHAAAQLNLRMDGRNVALHQKLHLRLDELESRIKQHAVGVVLRLAHHMGVRARENIELALPPRVGFHRQHEIGFLLADDREKPRRVPVRHQNIGEEQGDSAARVSVARSFDLAACKDGVRKHHVGLVNHGQRQQKGEHALPGARAVPRGEEYRQANRGDEHDLQPREVEHADPPGIPAQERQRGGHNHHRAEENGYGLHESLKTQVCLSDPVIAQQ